MHHHPITARKTKATLTQQLTLTPPSSQPGVKSCVYRFFLGGVGKKAEIQIENRLGPNNDI